MVGNWGVSTDAMSALGQKRTYAAQTGMSALPLKADMCIAQAHVCFGPKADMGSSIQSPCLLYRAALSKRIIPTQPATNRA